MMFTTSARDTKGIHKFQISISNTQISHKKYTQISLHYRHFKRHLHLKWPVVGYINNYMLYEMQPTGPARRLAIYTASQVRPKRKISCAAAQIAATQIAATLTISFPRWRHMSLKSYWGQQQMCLTFIFKVNHQGQVTDFGFSDISSTLQMLESTPKIKSVASKNSRRWKMSSNECVWPWAPRPTIKVTWFFVTYLISTTSKMLESTPRSISYHVHNQRVSRR